MNNSQLLSDESLKALPFNQEDQYIHFTFAIYLCPRISVPSYQARKRNEGILIGKEDVKLHVF